MDSSVRQNTIPPGQREENLEAANWAYQKQIERFRDWIRHHGTDVDYKKFIEVFGGPKP